MAANLFSSPEEEREWMFLFERYHEHALEARKSIASHYDRLRNGQLFRLADLRAAIELVEIECGLRADELSAKEYEDIIKGEEIWASMSINSES